MFTDDTIIQVTDKIDRAGWNYYNIPKPESVAAHMYRMSVMVMLLPDTLNINKLR